MEASTTTSNDRHPIQGIQGGKDWDNVVALRQALNIITTQEQIIQDLKRRLQLSEEYSFVGSAYIEEKTIDSAKHIAVYSGKKPKGKKQ